MQKKYFTLVLIVNLILLLLYIAALPDWLKRAGLKELFSYYPRFGLPLFIYLKSGIFLHLFIFLLYLKKYSSKRHIHLLFKHHFYLLLFPILILFNIRFYPLIHFPNLDFILRTDSNITVSPGITHKEIKTSMEPLEVHQSIYLIYYLNTEEHMAKALEYLKETEN